MTNVFDNRLISLREAEKDEFWLQDWICKRPERLGIGKFDIIEQDLRQYGSKGGRLDILGYSKSINTYYEIEVMLGECDSDHGFRSLDYWAREKIKHPNSKHYCVLVAENLQGRYKTLIETLPQYIPFIAIEIRTLEISTNNKEEIATIYAEIIAQPDDLIEEADMTNGRAPIPRDEDWWRTNKNDEYVDFVQTLYRHCEENVGTSRIDYTANSYISLKKGRRTWLPMWPRTNGCYVYIPDDGTGTSEKPSQRYYDISEKLEHLGINTTWTFNYNSGANPIGFPISSAHFKNSVILDILKESYCLT